MHAVKKADEEAATKAKAEEKTTKKEIKEAKREARKKVAKKKQPEEDTKENVSDNEEYDYQSDDAADKEKADEEIKKGKAALIVELKAIEKRAENKLKNSLRRLESPSIGHRESRSTEIMPSKPPKARVVG
ncbi:hypothetical protein Tco_1508100 [Tanacetum coccineum]